MVCRNFNKSARTSFSQYLYLLYDFTPFFPPDVVEDAVVLQMSRTRLCSGNVGFECEGLKLCEAVGWWIRRDLSNYCKNLGK